MSDTQAPFFDYTRTINSGSNESHTITEYWVFNPSTNGSYTQHDMGEPNQDNSGWEKMTTDFKYLITEAIFSKFAHLGSAIISGDWMISQHGTRGGDPSPDYIYFDPQHPFDDNGDIDNPNFIPYYAVDFNSGTCYQQNAIIYGKLYSSEGNIGGFVLDNDHIGNITTTQFGWYGAKIFSDGRAMFGLDPNDTRNTLEIDGGVVIVGNGKNVVVNTNTSNPKGYFFLNGFAKINLSAIPRDSTNLSTGEVFVDTNGYVRVKT